MRPSVLLLSLCACGPMLEDDAVVATAEQPITARGDPTGIIIMNGLSPQDLGENLLLNDPARRTLLINSSLSTATFSGGPLLEAVQANGPAERVFSYLVRCALKPSDTVSVSGSQYAGELGLCSEWAGGGIAGNAQCQQRVTGCVLGLSNAVNHHVPISMRGSDASDPWLTAAPRVYPLNTDVSANDVFSLRPCTAGTTYGVANDCGWQRLTGPVAHSSGIDTVFACVPGKQVVVSGGSSCFSGAKLGSMTVGADKVLRVCDGFAPCDHAKAIGEAQQDSCGTILPEVRFQCRDSGSYVVMQRDYMSPRAPTGPMTVGRSGADLGPATEKQLFHVREGAFFGTIFEGTLGRIVTLIRDPITQKTSVVTTIPVGATVVFERLYSCADQGWLTANAYTTKRLCALSPDQCLSNTVGFCRSNSGSACSGVVDDVPAGSGAFVNCKGSDGVTNPNAITTFPKAACDLVLGSCARL